ncbi:MAG: protease modulator HflK N-terminal domain-containing protein, partial [Pelagibacteraceae bacterium]|nr:protease modulator HflK N-terminal domain-containing protein [Pelagibacteraceae bacterium]MBO6488415.1 protease modulator HflK N-terminal domain-containing protein [Pelagibacteraceae bacterium]
MPSRDDIFKQQSPWGSPPGGDGNGSGRRTSPPNIDDLIRKAQGKIGKIFPGGKAGG